MPLTLLSAALLVGVGGFIVFVLWESLRPPSGPVRAGGLDIQLRTTPQPARVGENQVEIEIRQAGRAVADAGVELRYTPDPLAGPGPLAVAGAAPLGEGRYRGAVAFNRAGPWQLTVLVRRPGRPDAEATYTFNLPPEAEATIAGRIHLAPHLPARLGPDAAVFIIARRGPGPPVAVKRVANPTFPLAFVLGQADAMGGSPLEGELELVARIKRDGRAGPATSGDLEGRAPGPVRVGARDVTIVVDRAL